jgi:ketosteroid isomerase-like protein
MTKRHNRLAEVTRRVVIKFIGQELRSEIRENQKAEQAGLAEELKALRRDMIFEQRDRSPRRREEREEEGERKITEIIEFSCPCGCISHGRDTLEKTYEAKRAKYEELARTRSTLRQEKVRVMAIILSSMGAVYGPSMKDLQKILRCNNKEIKKLERKMSETTILGSLQIWRNNVMQIERGNRDDVNELIAEEEVCMEEAGAELEKERSRENEENRNQIEQKEEYMNEAEGEVEEFEEDEEEEEGENRQERQDIQGGRESEAGTEIGRMTRKTEDETGEAADTDADAGTRMIFGMTGDVADDEDEGQDSE